MAPTGNFVRNGMGFSIQFTIDGRKTHHGTLTTLDHRHPNNEHPHIRQDDNDRKGHQE